MPIDDQSAPAAGSAALAAVYAGPDYGAVLWEPTAESTRSTQLAAFARWLKADRGLDLDGALDPGGGLSLDGYRKLWDWSTGDPGTLLTYGELDPVRKILLGTPLEQAADPDSLANPEVLKFFAPQDAR